MGARKKITHTSSQPVAPAVPIPPPGIRKSWIIFAALALTCLIVYLPVWNNGFVHYDDAEYIHHNPPVRSGLGWDSVVWAFTSVSHYYWHPLTWLSHMLDVSLFGLEPGPHHLVSALLHALNAAFLFLALWRLSGSLWLAAAAAALHALHPLRVESVAWAAERKDVLSGLFFSLALLVYAGYVKSPSRRAYLWLCAAAAAAMMSKPTTVVLPALLLLLDWWPLGRFSGLAAVRPLMVEKLPLFAMSALVSLLTISGQQKALFSLDQLGLDPRIWNAIRSHACYLGKFLYPVDLAVFYPHVPLTAAEKAGMLLLFLAVPSTAFLLRKRAPYLLFGWLWFAVAMLPTSGLMQSGQQAYADRFTYIPAIGLAVASCCGLAALAVRAKIPSAGTAVFAAVILIALAALSRNQISYWKDTETMAMRAIAVTPANPNMDFLLAEMYLSENKLPQALAHYQSILRVYPESGNVHKQVGSIYLRTKEYARAVEEFQAAVKYRPHDVEVHKRIALALVQLGRTAEAVRELRFVLSQTPGDPDATRWLQSLPHQGGESK